MTTFTCCMTLPTIMLLDLRSVRDTHIALTSLYNQLADRIQGFVTNRIRQTPTMSPQSQQTTAKTIILSRTTRQCTIHRSIPTILLTPYRVLSIKFLAYYIQACCFLHSNCIRSAMLLCYLQSAALFSSLRLSLLLFAHNSLCFINPVPSDDEDTFLFRRGQLLRGQVIPIFT